VIEAIRRVPGVTAAAVTNSLPYTSAQSERRPVDITIKGRWKEETKLVAPLAGADVSDDYFRTMRIPLLRGRLFTASDTATSPYVAVINERGAKLFFPDRDPIGEEILWGQLMPSNPYCRIVGVVGDVRHQAAEGDNGIELYYPLTQWPIANSYYVVRTSGAADAVAAEITRTVASADPALAVAETKTMRQRIGESLWEQQLWAAMFALFAVLALVLAAVGLYGVMSHSVSQRRRELGIRMALGAPPGSVGRMVVGEALRLVAVGTVIGLGISLAVARLIRSLLHGVAASDPLVYLGITGVLALVALAAAWVPALRAARVDPVIALRLD
jgi:predicted permease